MNTFFLFPSLWLKTNALAVHIYLQTPQIHKSFSRDTSLCSLTLIAYSIPQLHIHSLFNDEHFT